MQAEGEPTAESLKDDAHLETIIEEAREALG